MALPTKPYDNKRHYDSGRLRHKIDFIGEVISDDGFGGTILLPDQVLLSTFAGKDDVSEWVQAGLNAGQTNVNQYQYFVIRNRKGFYPAKDMLVNYGNEKYIVQSVKQLDDPCTFLKILCVVSV